MGSHRRLDKVRRRACRVGTGWRNPTCIPLSLPRHPNSNTVRHNPIAVASDVLLGRTSTDFSGRPTDAERTVLQATHGIAEVWSTSDADLIVDGAIERARVTWTTISRAPSAPIRSARAARSARPRSTGVRARRAGPSRAGAPGGTRRAGGRGATSCRCIGASAGAGVGADACAVAGSVCNADLISHHGAPASARDLLAWRACPGRHSRFAIAACDQPKHERRNRSPDQPKHRRGCYLQQALRSTSGPQSSDTLAPFLHATSAANVARVVASILSHEIGLGVPVRHASSMARSSPA